MSLPFLYMFLASSALELSDVPVSFERNLGQTLASVKFLARSRGFTLLLTEEGAAITRGGAKNSRPLRLELVGAQTLTLEGKEPMERRSHYFLGDDPELWVVDVPHYARVVCRNAYPGIDLVFHARSGELEYDFVAAPGADIECIALRLDGPERMEVDENGDLLLHVEEGVLRQRKPLVYQGSGLGRTVVDGAYRIDADGIVRFRIAAHAPNLPLGSIRS